VILSNLINHAWLEFKAAGWLNDDDEFTDETQSILCGDVIDLLKIFSSQGHSGMSAPYAIELFSKLAKYEPLVPLTGEDWEWVHVGEQTGKLYQNKRCSHVFKDDEGAYDIQGIVWYDWITDKETGEKFKSHFTSRESRVKIEFPYTPKTEYREREPN